MIKRRSLCSYSPSTEMHNSDEGNYLFDELAFLFSPPYPPQEVLDDLYSNICIGNRTCNAMDFKKSEKITQPKFEPLGVFPSQIFFETYFKHRERGTISQVCKAWNSMRYLESEFCSNVRQHFVFYVPLHSTQAIIFALQSKLCHALNDEGNYFR